jgi:hypothetical protein
MDDNATTSEMNNLIANLEARLGASIDPMPFNVKDIFYQHWVLTEDRYGRMVLGFEQRASGRKAMWWGFALMVGIILVNMIGPRENPTGGWETWYAISGLLLIAIIMLEVCVGIAVLMEKVRHRWFRFDRHEELLTHNQPFQTESGRVLVNEIPFGRIAAFQLCGTKPQTKAALRLSRRYGHLIRPYGPLMGRSMMFSAISQLNLVLSDPPADRITLIELGANAEHLTGIAQQLAEETGIPLIVNERIDLESDELDELTEDKPRLAPDGLEQTRTRITVEKRSRKNDYLAVFEDKLYPDEDDDT